MKTVYIAGPMRGYPRFNFDAFELVETALRHQGWNVISPHRMDLDLGFDPDKSLEANVFSLDDAIRRDIDAIIKADAVYMMKGWEASSGARAEWAVAQCLSRTMIYQL